MNSSCPPRCHNNLNVLVGAAVDMTTTPNTDVIAQANGSINLFTKSNNGYQNENTNSHIVPEHIHNNTLVPTGGTNNQIVYNEEIYFH